MLLTRSLFAKLTPSITLLVAGLSVAVLSIAQSSGQTATPVVSAGIATTIAGGGTQQSASYAGAATSAALHTPERVAVDRAGNIYVAETAGRAVRVIASGKGSIPALPEIASPVAGNIYTVAGGNARSCAASASECVATEAALGMLRGVAVDMHGNVYIADDENDTVSVVYAAGKVAGFSEHLLVGHIYPLVGISGRRGNSPDPGPASTAQLSQPSGLSVDLLGNLFIADRGNNRVRVLYAGGSVQGVPKNATVGDLYTIAGSASTMCEQASACGDKGSATASLLANPDAVTVDNRGNVYISDSGDARLRVISGGGALPGIAAPIAGFIYTVAGGIAQGATPRVSALSTVLGQVAVDAAGNVYIPDSAAGSVRRLDTNGTLSLIFGQGGEWCSAENGNTYGDGCSALGARLAWPSGLAIDPAGHIYIADTQHQRIRTIVADSVSTDIKGDGLTPQTRVGAPASPALLNALHAQLQTQAATTLGSGDITTIVGGPGITADPIPSGPANAVRANSPQFMTVDTNGNIYFTTSGNNDVEVLYSGSTPPQVLVAEQPGTPSFTQGYVYQVAGGYPGCVSGTATTPPCGDTGPAVGQGILNTPYGIAVDSTGNLFIADTGNGAIREVLATGPNAGTIISVAGTPFSPGYSPDGTPAASALLSGPTGLLVDAAGDIYFTDQNSSLARVIYTGGNVPTLPAGITYTSNPSTLYTIAGVNGQAGYNADGIPANTAWLNAPFGLALDKNNNLYVADAFNNLVRMVSATDQTISSVAGDASLINSANGNGCATAPCGDGGSATSALLSFVYDVKVDGGGNLFLADNSDATIRKVAADSTGSLTSTSIITAIAGQELVSTGYAGDPTPPGPATAAILNTPNGIALDANGNLYIADSGDNVIREVGTVGTLAKQSQTITFPALPTVTYGASLVPLAATASSLLPVTYQVTAGSPATIASNGTSLVLTGAGIVTVQASQSGNSMFNAALTVSQAFTVNPAILTVTAADVYLAAGITVDPTTFPSPRCTVNLISPDTRTGDCAEATSVTGQQPPVGTYPITPSLGTLAVSNPTSYATPYTYVPATLHITGNQTQTLTFPALPASVFPYGTAPLALTATSSSGLAVSYTATGSAHVTGSAGTGYSLTVTGIGAGSVTATQIGDSRYAPATPATQTFNVTPIIITVAATNITSPFGSTVNASRLSYTIAPAQLVNGDLLVDTPALSTTATAASPTGSTYPITVAQGTLAIQPASSSGFYSFNFVPGTLTITGGVQTISFPAYSGSATYGGSITLNATASTGYPITYTFTGQLNVINGAGQQSVVAANGPLTVGLFDVGTITVTATQAGDATYSAAPPVSQTLTVAAAPLLVTLNTPVYTEPEGAQTPTFGYTITGFVGNDTFNATTVQGIPSITTTATPSSPAGIYPVVLSLGTLVSPLGRYTFTFQNGSLDVTTPPGYILTANPSTLTIPTGSSQQTTIIATAITGQAPYQGTIALSCSGLPAGVTCTFSPATLTLALGPSGTGDAVAQSTLTINTNPSTAVVAALVPHGKAATIAAAAFLLPGCILGFILCWQRRKLRSYSGLFGILLLVILLTGLSGLSACGGGGSASGSGMAAPGTTMITLSGAATGTNGSGSPNLVTNITLTIHVTK